LPSPVTRPPATSGKRWSRCSTESSKNSRGLVSLAQLVRRWQEQIARLTDRGIRTLVSPDAGNRKAPGLTRQRREHYLEMRQQLATDEGKRRTGSAKRSSSRCSPRRNTTDGSTASNDEVCRPAGPSGG
jgi:acyl-CoA synthetase (NDP forming)